MNDISSPIPLFSTHNLSDLCYSNDESHLITCTYDGYIYITNINNNTTKQKYFSKECYRMTIHNDNRLIVATDRNQLEVYSYSEDNIYPSLYYSIKTVSALHLRDSLLFVGTSDFNVAMINLNGNLKDIKYFHGHNAVICYLNAYLEKGLLLTSSNDGVIKIFNINHQNMIKEFNVHDEFDILGSNTLLILKPDWDTIDQILAVPIKNSIHFYEIDKWIFKNSFKNDSINDNINQVNYNTSRLMFVVGYENGEIMLVNRMSLIVLISFSTKGNIYTLLWNKYKFTSATTAGNVFLYNVSQFFRLNESMKFDDVVEANASFVKEKKDYLILYIIYFFMTKKFIQLKMDQTTRRIFVNDNSNSEFFEFQMINDPIDIKFQMFKCNDHLMVHSDCPVAKAHPKMRLEIDQYVNVENGIFGMTTSVPKLKNHLHTTYRTALKMIDNQQQLNDLQQQQQQVGNNSPPPTATNIRPTTTHDYNFDDDDYRPLDTPLNVVNDE